MYLAKQKLSRPRPPIVLGDIPPGVKSIFIVGLGAFFVYRWLWK